jgi:hypothetical protein
MHSRINIKTLSASLRTSLVGLSLTGYAIGSEQLFNYPMTGACFLHDSGLEYIPSRLIGCGDIVTDSDRGESATWTCSDPAMDCAVQAEKFEQRQVAIKQWDRWHSLSESLRDWSAQSLRHGVAQAVREWNASLVAIGCGLAHRVSIDSPFDNDSAWDDREITDGTNQEHCLGYLPIQRFRNAHVFVFAVDTPADEPAEELAIQQQQAIDACQIASPSDRIAEPLGMTMFARDYCVFAPYAMSEAIESSSPCEWTGECEALDSQDVAGSDVQAVADLETDSELAPVAETPPVAETTEEDGVSPSSQLGQPLEFSQPTGIDQASDRATGAGPEASAVAGGGTLESAPDVESLENPGIRQRATVDVYRSVSRTLARNLSVLGHSLIHLSEKLDNRVRLTETQDASRVDGWK